MSENEIYQHPIKVGERHIDLNGHVNNVIYVQWMQDVAYAHSQSVGFDSQRLNQLGSTWVVRSHFIKYQRPVLRGDEIIVSTWLSSIKRASALRVYRFTRSKDDAVLAQGETDWVYIDRNTGRPKAIEEEMIAAFGTVPNGLES